MKTCSFLYINFTQTIKTVDKIVKKVTGEKLSFIEKTNVSRFL